jgi:hypothetical protein
VRRLRGGELLALAGSAAVAASLALPWYSSPTGDLGAWKTFGPAVALLIVAALLGVALALVTLTERTPALPVATAVWSTLFGLVAVVAAAVRLLESPDGASSPRVGAWLALAGALALAIGSWQSMRDERTSLYPLPERADPRPAPPERGS